MSPAVHNPDPSTNPSKASTALAGGKRKREPSSHIPANSPDKAQEDGHVEQLHQLFKDIVEILKSTHVRSMQALLTSHLPSHDVTPSILNHKLPSSSTDIPHAKRAKLASASEERTIALLVEVNGYNSVSDFSKDLEYAIAAVTKELELAAVDGDVNDRTQIKSQRHPDVVRAMAFKQEFNNIILREIMQRPHLMNVEDTESHESPNGQDASAKLGLPAGGVNNEDEQNYSPVLTLFGGSGGGSGQPKQLFSSLKNARGSLRRGADDSKGRLCAAGLPNGISFTKVVPVHSQGDQERKDIPTIGKHFAPPPSVQPLNPPRQSRHTATRSSSVNWYNPAEITTPNRPSRRDSYSTQPLTTGQWLTYNVVPSTKDLSSPESKRKQRDRALSFGEPQTEPSEQILALHRQAQEDALFRSVYSGFAPDQDNAGALVPQQTKNSIWWKRVGEQRYHNSRIRARQAPSYASFTETAQVPDQPEMSLEEAVKSWTPDDRPADFSAEGGPDEKHDATTKDMEEMLNEISELLETLNSYQDVRNLSLANNARTSTSHNPQLSGMTGTPTSPSLEELGIYQMLQSQLSIMVSSLPPYALAKLDGRKLGILNINTKIQVEMENYTGSLEEDEISTRVRQPAVSATASYPSRTPNAAVGLAPRNNYLAASSTPAAIPNRPSHMPQTVPTRATAPSSYLPNPQYSTRPPSANQYFGRGPYATNRPVSGTPDRYPYSGAQAYSQSAGRPSYANGYNQYPSQNGTTYGQGYAHSQQPSSSGRVAPAAYPQSTGRPTQSYSYGAGPGVVGGSASPSKAAALYASQMYANASNGVSQPRPQLYHQHSSQYSNQGPSSPQVNGSSMGGASTPQGQVQGNGDAGGEMQGAKGAVAEVERRSSSTGQAGNAGASLPNGTAMVQANGGMTVPSG
ncbi:MAG: hypothetical protein L6R40_004824 [Gallowayella cf. fulva]|nr:MAG: hypothetical protein L6R40_004824 [Xanthomendoza cf. fulva]